VLQKKIPAKAANAQQQGLFIPGQSVVVVRSGKPTALCQPTFAIRQAQAKSSGK
jgi:hypothetical protein